MSSNPITFNSNCIKYQKQLPSFTPVIYSLSTTFSSSGNYSFVNIIGENFYPNGVTKINFGSFKNISFTYYSSFNISFLVPLNASAGIYHVIAVNIYNDNFSTPVK
jgi:hypothetical protein